MNKIIIKMIKNAIIIISALLFGLTVIFLTAALYADLPKYNDSPIKYLILAMISIILTVLLIKLDTKIVEKEVEMEFKELKRQKS